MENIKTEIMQLLDMMPEYALHIVLGFIRRLAQYTVTGHNSQRG